MHTPQVPQHHQPHSNHTVLRPQPDMLPRGHHRRGCGCSATAPGSRGHGDAAQVVRRTFQPATETPSAKAVCVEVASSGARF